MIDVNHDILDNVFDEIYDTYAVMDTIEVWDDITVAERMDGHDAVAWMDAYDSEFGIDYDTADTKVTITLMRSKIPSMAMSLLADRIWDAIWQLEQDGTIRKDEVVYGWNGKTGILYY